jgi:hypothetical protein
MRNSVAQTRMMKVMISPTAPCSVASLWLVGAQGMAQYELSGQGPREKAAAFRT